MKKNEALTIPQMLSEIRVDMQKRAPSPWEGVAMLPEEEAAHLRHEIITLAGYFADRHNRPAQYLYVGVDALAAITRCGLMDTRYTTADALGLEVVPVPRKRHLRVS